MLSRRRVLLARLLVEHGPHTTTQDNHGLTPLHLAVENGSMDLARVLVEHGADVAAQKKGVSPQFHLACSLKGVGIPRLLVEHGANAATWGNHGSIPLNSAS